MQPMLQANGDYREFLKEEYCRRRSRNSGYSLRAFARDLGLSYSRLNESINYKKGLSAKAAEKIAKSLSLTNTEREILISLVEAAHGRSKASRQLAKEKLQSILKAVEPLVLSREAFQFISNWYHYAILELIRVNGFEYNPAWIAERLGITPTEVKVAISRLKKMNLLAEKMGLPVSTQDFVASTTDLPSEGLKVHHDQLLDLAKAAIYLQPLEERDFSSITMAFNKKDMPKAKQMIKAFRRNFYREMNVSDEKDTVYAITVQFFQLDKKNNNQGSNTK